MLAGKGYNLEHKIQAESNRSGKRCYRVMHTYKHGIYSD